MNSHSFRPFKWWISIWPKQNDVGTPSLKRRLLCSLYGFSPFTSSTWSDSEYHEDVDLSSINLKLPVIFKLPVILKIWPTDICDLRIHSQSELFVWNFPGWSHDLFYWKDQNRKGLMPNNRSMLLSKRWYKRLSELYLSRDKSSTNQVLLASLTV